MSEACQSRHSSFSVSETAGSSSRRNPSTRSRSFGLFATGPHQLSQKSR
jgi:hypothetical protein